MLSLIRKLESAKLVRPSARAKIKLRNLCLLALYLTSVFFFSKRNKHSKGGKKTNNLMYLKIKARKSEFFS